MINPNLQINTVEMVKDDQVKDCEKEEEEKKAC